MTTIGKRKTAKCPGCMPHHAGAIFRVERECEDWDAGDLVFRTYWICQNCGHKSLIKRRRPFTPNEITKRQHATLERLRRTLPLFGKYDELGDRYEWKKWDVKTTDYGPVWLTAEFGRIGDEGTAASIICRDYWFIEIGPGGKVKSHSRPHWHTRERDRRI